MLIESTICTSAETKVCVFLVKPEPKWWWCDSLLLMCNSHLYNTILSLINSFFILSSKHTVHNAVSVSPALSSVHLHHCILFSVFFLFHRSLTSNLPSVNLPNVNLQMPKVPNLPVSVNLPPMQMPSFSTPNWIPGLSNTECVLSLYRILMHACVALAWTYCQLASFLTACVKGLLKSLKKAYFRAS